MPADAAIRHAETNSREPTASRVIAAATANTMAEAYARRDKMIPTA